LVNVQLNLSDGVVSLEELANKTTWLRKVVGVRSKTVQFYILNSRGLSAIVRQPRGLPHNWLSTYSAQNNYFWPHPVRNARAAPAKLIAPRNNFIEVLLNW